MAAICHLYGLVPARRGFRANAVRRMKSRLIRLWENLPVRGRVFAESAHVRHTIISERAEKAMIWAARHPCKSSVKGKHNSPEARSGERAPSMPAPQLARVPLGGDSCLRRPDIH